MTNGNTYDRRNKTDEDIHVGRRENKEVWNRRRLDGSVYKEDIKQNGRKSNNRGQQIMISLPKFIQFETETTCNQRCSFCPHGKMTKREQMNDELIAKIIKECIPTAEACCPFLMQDPILEPRILDILKEIKKTNWRCQTTLYTTMSNATDEQITRIVNEGLLNNLFVSLYGTEWQKGLNEEKAEANVMKLYYEKRKQCKTYPKITMMRIHDLEDIETAKKKLDRWHHIADWMQIVPFDTFHGTISEPDRGRTRGPNKERNPCHRLWNGMNIHSNGVVVPCCIDYDEMMPMGNMNRQSALEIWNSDKFNELRELHMQKRFDEIELCKNCNVWEWM